MDDEIRFRLDRETLTFPVPADLSGANWTGPRAQKVSIECLVCSECWKAMWKEDETLTCPRCGASGRGKIE